jgi:hypothetical protein
MAGSKVFRIYGAGKLVTGVPKNYAFGRRDSVMGAGFER